MDELRKEWYRLNDIDTSNMDNLDKRFHSGLKAGILKAMNILAAEDIHSDKGYEVASLADADAFAHKRNHQL